MLDDLCCLLIVLIDDLVYGFINKEFGIGYYLEIALVIEYGDNRVAWCKGGLDIAIYNFY